MTTIDSEVQMLQNKIRAALRVLGVDVDGSNLKDAEEMRKIRAQLGWPSGEAIDHIQSLQRRNEALQRAIRVLLDELPIDFLDALVVSYLSTEDLTPRVRTTMYERLNLQEQTEVKS